jgi:hypothetical protein
MVSSESKYTFAGGEVTVTIPSSLAGRLKAASLDVGQVDMAPASGFKPIRVVANIVIEAQDRPGVALTDLGGPVAFKVQYRASDLQAAGSQPLRLAFWDGSTWVVLTEAKHAFKLTPSADSKDGGYATISISRWGDPPLSWGT